MAHHALSKFTIITSMTIVALSGAPIHSMHRLIKNAAHKSRFNSRYERILNPRFRFSSSSPLGNASSPYPYSYTIGGVERVIENPEEAGSDHERILELHALNQKMLKQDKAQKSVFWEGYFRSKQCLDLELECLEKGRRTNQESLPSQS